MSEHQPEVLHESQGLRIVRNARNQFVTCWLHYLADPSKRAPEWRREAAAGMTPEQAARELEIDFTALLGAKVFPEITARRADIIIQEPYPDFGPDARYWGGLDYGSRNPTSFHVYTIDDGVMYAVWELYKPCKNIKEFAAEMREFPYWNSLRYIAADPDFWLAKQSTLTGMTTLEALFREAGVRNLVKGDNLHEMAWITMLREHWAADEPTFKILGCCPNLISEFETAIYVNQSQHQLDTQNYREEISNWHNHALDDCKYFMLTRPQEQSARSFEDPRLVNRWAQGGRKGRTAQRPAAQFAPLRGYH